MGVVQFNWKQMRDAFKRRNLSMEEISVEMGYGRTFMRDCTSRGNMKLAPARSLKSMFGIDYKDYPVDPVQEPVEVTKVPEVTSWDGLSEVIQSSIRSSIRSAIEDNRKELEDMMERAFRKALNR